MSIYGDIDLRTREQGKIIIRDNVSFDTSSRFVAANQATLVISEGSEIGPYCIFNCGTNVYVGMNVLMAGFCLIQSSSREMKKNLPIKSQPHNYGEIHIGDDCWLGTRVSVLKGVTLGKGCVVGANAVITKNIEDNSISVGVPAKPIKFRV